MARGSKVEACIFCGNLPCTCNTKSAPSPKRQAKPKQEAQGGKSDDLFDTALKPRNRFKKRVEQAEEAAESQDTLELHQAIRNLEPILSSSEKRRWQSVLKPPLPPAVERRLVEWRERHAESEDLQGS